MAPTTMVAWGIASPLRLLATMVQGESLLLKGNRSFCKAWEETEAGTSLRVASLASFIKPSFIFFIRKSEGPLPLGRHRGVREVSVWRQ